MSLNITGNSTAVAQDLTKVERIGNYITILHSYLKICIFMKKQGYIPTFMALVLTKELLNRLALMPKA